MLYKARPMERKNSHSSNRDGFLLRSESRPVSTTSSEFVLQWGNRKKLRCMKVQAKDNATTSEPNGSGTARLDRRLVGSNSNLNNNNISSSSKYSIPSQKNNNTNSFKPNNGGVGIGYLNLRQRPASPSRRILRNNNTEGSIGMRGHSNGVRGLASQDRVDKKVTATTKNNNNINHHNENHHYHSGGGGGGGGGSGSSETAHEARKGGSSSAGDAIAAAVWPPKFVIALTNKEKEEDFLAIKGSKLPQRPKKRAKFIQRTLNLVSPGAWLCDLTLDRYEVREKKISKKRPRGLKAMGNMESDSE